MLYLFLLKIHKIIYMSYNDLIIVIYKITLMLIIL